MGKEGVSQGPSRPGSCPLSHSGTGRAVIRGSETGGYPDRPPNPAHRVDWTRLHKTGKQEVWGSNLTSAIS